MTAMMTLDRPDARIGHAPLDAPGGFAWWYVDLVGPSGSGVVIIASFGLPFLPGYTDAARRDEAQPARQKPSLNVVVYEDGRESFYLLQELDAARASLDESAGVFVLGDSRLTLERDGDVGTLRVELDAPLPRSTGRLRGAVTLSGALCRAEGDAPPASEHRWTPLLAGATGHAALDLDGREVAFEGTAYHDRNASPTHLDGLGIDVWFWGRARRGDETRVWYVVRPTDPATDPLEWALTIHADGRVERHDDARIEFGPLRRDTWGVPWPDRVIITRGDDPWLDATHGRCVDRGPFYLRGPVHGRFGDDGDGAEGWAEVVVPSRIDLPRHRPLVRMRVHRPEGRNSMWLPLFSGPREGRIRRLLRPAQGARS